MDVQIPTEINQELIRNASEYLLEKVKQIKVAMKIVFGPDQLFILCNKQFIKNVTLNLNDG